MSSIRYTNAQRLKALEVFDRTQSVTKIVRELGYPGRWTLHRWIRQRSEPPSSPIRRTTLKRYPFATKLKGFELFNSGMSPDTVAAELSLNSKMSVYAWAQRVREEGKGGLMSATERKQSAGSVTHNALEKSLPGDATQLKKLAARLSAEKAVLEKELEEIKKTTASTQPISVTYSKLLWSMRYGLLFLFHCCLTSSGYCLLPSIISSKP